MLFLLLPVAAGLAVALQNVFYDKIGEQVGVMGTVVIVHVFGLIASLIVYFLTKGTITNLTSGFNAYMVLAGMLGVIVVSGITKSVSVNGVLLTVMLTVVAQLALAKVIAHFGWFGVVQNPINWLQVLALFLMVAGVFIYQKS